MLKVCQHTEITISNVPYQSCRDYRIRVVGDEIATGDLWLWAEEEQRRDCNHEEALNWVEGLGESLVLPWAVSYHWHGILLVHQEMWALRARSPIRHKWKKINIRFANNKFTNNRLTSESTRVHLLCVTPLTVVVVLLSWRHLGRPLPDPGPRSILGKPILLDMPIPRNIPPIPLDPNGNPGPKGSWCLKRALDLWCGRWNSSKKCCSKSPKIESNSTNGSVKASRWRWRLNELLGIRGKLSKLENVKNGLCWYRWRECSLWCLLRPG